MGKYRIDVEMGGKDVGAGSAVEGLGQKLKMLRKESRASGEMLLERSLESPEGLARAFFGSLGIGLEAAVVGGLGEGLARATDKAVAMNKELAEGKANAADLVNEFAKELPLLGGFVRTFENLRELITGERGEIERINEAAKLTTEYYNLQAKLAREVREADQGRLESLRKIANEIKLIDLSGSSSGADKAAIERINQAHDAVVAQEDEKLRKAKEGGGEAGELRNKMAGFDAAHEPRVAELQTKIDHMEELQRQHRYIPGFTTDSNLEAARKELADIKSERAQFQQQIGRLDGQTRDKVAKAQKTHDDVIAADSEKTDKAVKAEEIRQTEAWMEKKRQKSLELADQQAAIDKGLREAQSEARQHELEGLGRTLDAEKERIRSSYDERIRLARSYEEKVALLQSEAAEERDARNKDLKRRLLEQIDYKRQALQDKLDSTVKPGFNATLLGSHFTGMAEHQRDDAARVANNTSIMIRHLDRIARLLEKHDTSGRALGGLADALTFGLSVGGGL